MGDHTPDDSFFKSIKIERDRSQNIFHVDGGTEG